MAYTTIGSAEEELKKVKNKAALAGSAYVSGEKQVKEAPLQEIKSRTQGGNVGGVSGSAKVWDSVYDGSYESALQMLNETRKNMPTYSNGYDRALQDLFTEITARERFSYSPSEDALYQNYKQQYTDLGKLAMKDTMGQAAALTGGYGSSYGQSVGQQSYHGYLQQLNQMMPELYGMAYQTYRDEGEALQNQYHMVRDMADDEYGKYTDRLTGYYKDLGYWQGNADTAYNREQAAAQEAYDRQQQAYDRLMTMITTMGYSPDADELTAAGMSEAHKNAYLKYYQQQHASGGGGGGRGKKTDLYDHVLNAAMNELEKNGVESANSSVMNYVDNGLTVKQVQSIMKKVTDEFMK